MKFKVIPIFAAIALAIPMFACDKMDDGPAENAGERIDEVVEDGKDNVSDALEEAGEKVEEAGDAIRDKTDS